MAVSQTIDTATKILGLSNSPTAIATGIINATTKDGNGTTAAISALSTLQSFATIMTENTSLIGKFVGTPATAVLATASLANDILIAKDDMSKNGGAIANNTMVALASDAEALLGLAALAAGSGPLLVAATVAAAGLSVYALTQSGSDTNIYNSVTNLLSSAQSAASNLGASLAQNTGNGFSCSFAGGQSVVCTLTAAQDPNTGASLGIQQSMAFSNASGLESKDTVGLNSSGNIVDDLLGTNSSNTTLWEQVTTASASGSASQTISGHGDIDYINNASISVAAGSQATLTGNSNNVNGSTSENLIFNGTGNSLNASGNDQNSANYVTVGDGGSLTFNGNWTQINAGNNVAIAAAGTLDTIIGKNNDSLAMNGGLSTVDDRAGTGSTISIVGRGGIFADTVDSNSNSIQISNGSGVSIFGNNNTTTGSYSDTLIFGGTGNSLTASGNDINSTNNITVNDGGSLNFSGNWDVVNAGNSATVSGAGAVDNLIGKNSDNLTMNGVFDTLNDSSGTGSLLTMIGGGGSFTNSVQVGNNSQLSIQGGSNTVTGGYSDTFGFNGGGNSLTTSGTAQSTYDTVNVSAGSSLTFNGNWDLVNAANSTTISGSGTLDQIVGSSGSNLSMNGALDTVNDYAGTGSTITITGGGGIFTNVVDSNYNNVNVNSGSELTVNGGGNGINLFGTNDNLTASNNNIGVAEQATCFITGNHDNISGQGESAYKDIINVFGTYDGLTVKDGGNANFYGAHTGDTVTETGGTWAAKDVVNYYPNATQVGNAGPSDPDGDGDTDAPGQDDSVGQILTQLYGSNQSAFNPTQGSMGMPFQSTFEGGAWQGNTITWSFADHNNTGSDPDDLFSGFIQGNYRKEIEKAVKAWAAASGLKFKEVSDSQSADMRIGWGEFDTATTGQIGQTNPDVNNGQLQPGMSVRIEDPTQLALNKVKGSTDKFYYDGTDVSLYQVALHEIGHALGLGDSNDPNSVMYYAASSANQELDATDISGVNQLYDYMRFAALPGDSSAFGDNGSSNSSYMAWENQNATPTLASTPAHA